MYRLIVGGPSISEATLLRFYAWHLLGLGIPILALIVWHGFRVRRDGGVSSPARKESEEIPPRTDREVIIRREWLTFFLTLATLIVISIFVDAPIGPAAEPGALVEHTKAPWIFLWVQELLRSWPPAIAGVFTPLAILAILTLLPYTDWSNDGVAVWFNRQGRIPQILLILVLLGVLGLTVLAALR
jgi:quinol-cytochrome oxidoreductase complex cytochrome b subunit